MSDLQPGEPTPPATTSSIGQDPLGQVERAQNILEKGPITAVAAFFVISFFVALFLLLRSKDKQQASQAALQADHSKEIARLTEKHGAEMASLYTQERERAVKNEVTMSNYLDMMEDVRFIAFEMRRVKLAREKRKGSSDEPDKKDDPHA